MVRGPAFALVLAAADVEGLEGSHRRLAVVQPAGWRIPVRREMSAPLVLILEHQPSIARELPTIGPVVR
jgi:hypothetical protein